MVQSGGFQGTGCTDSDPVCSNPANIGRFGNAGVERLARQGESMNTLSIHGREAATGKCIAVTVEAGQIISVDDAPQDCDLWISAGLIDLQVNGYLGLDLNGDNASPETVSQLTGELLATGVTTFAPTVVTAFESEILRRLAYVSEARRADSVARKCIPYVHVEGPHISPLDGYRGGHRLEAVRPPSVQEFDRWQAACDGLVGLVTLSPHYPGSEEYISELVNRGVHVSIGHTHASAAQIDAAVQAGARLSTHLGNGIALQLDRHPNPIWTQLADDRLTACFIADGQHLPADALKTMIRAKGFDRSILVSDLVTLAGMPAGTYVIQGKAVELTPEGRLQMTGSRLLSGAVVPLIDCVGTAMKLTQFSLAEVLKMATEIPGRFAGDRGLLTPGRRADIFRFRLNVTEASLTVEDVWLDGEAIQAASRRR
jgi:N-acetylglucosamine-6-phosphate deacetylase